MNTHVDLEKLLSTLREVREVLHETADPSVGEQLDRAIADIEKLKESTLTSDEVKMKVLECLNNGFKAFNLIADISKWFSG